MCMFYCDNYTFKKKYKAQKILNFDEAKMLMIKENVASLNCIVKYFVNLLYKFLM